MMQAAQAWAGDDRRLRTRPLLDRPAQRRVFGERVVDAVALKVVDVFSQQPSQVLFVEWDHMVEQLSPTASHPPFGDAVLPGRSDARPLRLEPRILEEVDDVSVEFGVPIEDDVAIRSGFGKRFAQLLDDPCRIGVSGDVAMQNPATVMVDDEEAVEQLKRRCGHGEEVEGGDGLAVIPQESRPSLSGAAPASNQAQVASDGPFGDDKA